MSFRAFCRRNMLCLGFQISQNGRSLCAFLFGSTLHGILHIQSRIKLCQSLTFRHQFRFLRKRFSKFTFGRFLLIVEIGQLFIGSFKPFWDTCKGIIQTGDVTPRIGAKGYTVAYRAFQNDVALVSEIVERKLHLEPTVTAQGDRIGAFYFLTRCQNPFTGICFFRIMLATDVHAAEPLGELRVSFYSLPYVLFPTKPYGTDDGEELEIALKDGFHFVIKGHGVLAALQCGKASFARAKLCDAAISFDKDIIEEYQREGEFEYQSVI